MGEGKIRDVWDGGEGGAEVGLKALAIRSWKLPGIHLRSWVWSNLAKCLFLLH